MSDLINIGNKVTTVDVSTPFDVYTKVVIHIDDDTQVVAGNDTGRTLEIDNPFGNQAMANRILASLRGFQYSPYTANGALLDPAAEIGDAVETITSFGGIYTRSRNFGRLMKADVSAPCDEEIDHEFKYESPSERKFRRTVGDVKASIILTNNMIQSEVTAREVAVGNEAAARAREVYDLSSRIRQTADEITAEVTRATEAEGNLSSQLSVQATKITAKVSAEGGSNTSGSFSWSLTSDGHYWYANGGEDPVMSVTATGLTVNGTVNATSGTIGGFTIGGQSIRYNGMSWTDNDKAQGIYIGVSGIKLGQNFKVSNSGAVTASSLALKGTLTFLNDDGTVAGTMSAANLRTGAEQAYNNYTDWNSAYSSTTSGGYCYGGAGYGYSFGNAIKAGATSYPAQFTCGWLYAKKSVVFSDTLTVLGKAEFLPTNKFGAHDASWQSQYVLTGVDFNLSESYGKTIYYYGRT